MTKRIELVVGQVWRRGLWMIGGRDTITECASSVVTFDRVFANGEVTRSYRLSCAEFYERHGTLLFDPHGPQPNQRWNVAAVAHPGFFALGSGTVQRVADGLVDFKFDGLGGTVLIQLEAFMLNATPISLCVDPENCGKGGVYNCGCANADADVKIETKSPPLVGPGQRWRSRAVLAARHRTVYDVTHVALVNGRQHAFGLADGVVSSNPSGLFTADATQDSKGPEFVGYIEPKVDSLWMANGRPSVRVFAANDFAVEYEWQADLGGMRRSTMSIEKFYQTFTPLGHTCPGCGVFIEGEYVHEHCTEACSKAHEARKAQVAESRAQAKTPNFKSEGARTGRFSGAGPNASGSMIKMPDGSEVAILMTCPFKDPLFGVHSFDFELDVGLCPHCKASPSDRAARWAVLEREARAVFDANVEVREELDFKRAFTSNRDCIVNVPDAVTTEFEKWVNAIAVTHGVKPGTPKFGPKLLEQAFEPIHCDGFDFYKTVELRQFFEPSRVYIASLTRCKDETFLNKYAVGLTPEHAKDELWKWFRERVSLV